MLNNAIGYDLYITTLQEVMDETLKIVVANDMSGNYVTIKCEGNINEDIRYQLFDLEGNMIICQRFLKQNIDIPISLFRSTTDYFIRVMNGKKVLGTYKLVRIIQV